jgi:hypothetical protein
MGQIASIWPDDADGDVLRSLASRGFDFAKPWSVDFDVDFESWPPAPAALELLGSMFGEVFVYPPEAGDAVYVQFKVVARVTYELVTSVQLRATCAMSPYGGVCESWGVLH